MNGIRWVDGLAQDLRYVRRQLRRSPGSGIVPMLMMALGIGATTTLFSLTYGVLLKPLPWSEPDRIVRLQETRGGSPGRVPWTISNTTYHAWRERPATIEGIGGWMRSQLMTMTVGSGEVERLVVGRVTPSLLRVLRVQPRAGRLFAEDEATAREAAGVVVLAFGLWQRRFGGDPDVIGRTLRLDDRLLTIVGVMEEDLAFPDRETQAWLPLEIARVRTGADVIPGQIFNAVARLRDGVTAQQAASEATARGRAAPSLGTAGVALFGSSGAIAVAAMPARDALTADVRPALIVLLAAVGLIFSTALASVLVLQASRAMKRRREMAVRMAIGAGAGRLARQWLVESATLGVGGGTVGLLVAAGLHRLLPVVLPPDFPRMDEVAIDTQVAGFASVLTLAAIIACGLVPALQVRDQSLIESLAGDATAPGPGAATTRSTRVLTAMMVAQVAIACVLLVGTVLLARSFTALLAADRGFNPHDVLTAHLTTKKTPFALLSGGVERAQQRLQALPAVVDVGFGNALPFVTTGGLGGFTMPSPKDPDSKVQVQTLMRTVSPEYFPALGLRVIAGRALDRTDTASSRPVVVVNRTFAAQYLDVDPIGTVLPIAIGARREWEVVGVVDEVRQGGLSGLAPAAFGGVADPPQPEMFFTYSQSPDNAVSELAYVIRGGASSASLAPMLRAILREEAPSLAIDSVMTMEDRVMHSLARPRTYAVLLGGFALFAVAIAAVGLFGVMSYIATQRTREIGIRTALGAQPHDIMRLVTREALAIYTGGLVIGLAAAFFLVKSLAPLLYGVSIHDATSFIAVPIILSVVVAVACVVPARRATRVSPLVALRHE